MKRYIKSAVKDLSSEDERSRNFIAEDPNNSPRILEKLADDPSALIRSKVARNPNTPIEILKKLAKDPSRLVRNTVFLNKNTPEDVAREITRTIHIHSGKAEITFRMSVVDDRTSRLIREGFEELGYTVYSAREGTDFYNDDMDGHEVVETTYICICGIFDDKEEVYRAVDIIGDWYSDFIIEVYDVDMLLA